MRQRLPRRPRRYWRYVSPQRRGVALLILALLLTAVYGYWYLTNDSRIRRQARRYLRDMTGARVSIDRASFSLFGDIRLEGVRLEIPGGQGVEPFFSARSVAMRHRSWSVFFGGSIKPTEIVSVDAEVTDSPETRAFMRARSPTSLGGEAGGLWDLPVIRVGSCQYMRIKVVAGIRVHDKPLDIDVDMIPKDQSMVYDVYVAEREGTRVIQKYHIETQLTPVFKGTILSGAGDLVATTDIILPEYRKWIKNYQIEGRYSVEGPVSVSENAVEGVLKLKLENVSFKLPKAQGGLSLSNVAGTLIFTPPDESGDDERKNGLIELTKGVTGQIAEAGGATVRLSGKYRGYRLDSPFSVKIEIDEMTLPMTLPTTRPTTRPQNSLHPEFKRILERIERDYSPAGTAKMVVNLSREPGQDGVSVDGTIKPKKMTAAYRYVPYRIDLDDTTRSDADPDSEIHFTNDLVVVRKITGSREGGTFTINAVAPIKANPKTGKWEWTATIDVDSARMSETAARALPKRTFVGKPYPFRNITGRVHSVNGRTWVEQDSPLRSKGQGDMRCALYGQVKWTPKGIAVDVYIKADDVPIDRALIDSLDKSGRYAMSLLSPSGLARRLSLEIHDGPDKKFDYKMTAGLTNVSMTYKGFPYDLTDLQGDVTVAPKVITLENMSGRHNRSPVTLHGKLYPGDKKVGVDLTVGAGQLVVDKELYRALPSELKKIWDSLVPSGQADVSLLFKENLPGRGKKLDYHLEIRPKGMTVTYEGFSYKFSGVTGLVVAEPGVVTLRKLKCGRGYQLDGEIRDDGRELKLKIDARGVPLDKKLLAALPNEFKGALSTVKPGGTVDIDIKDLTIIRGKSEAPATAPASLPSRRIPRVTKRLRDKDADDILLVGSGWLAQGVLGLHDTTLDIAFGAKKLNGKLDGWIGLDSRGLAIDSDADLDKIMVGSREVTDVKGLAVKKAGSPLVRIQNLEARVYGGRLAGREVMIRLSDPVKYAFSLFYQGVSLSDLVNSGVKDPTGRAGVRGVLEGKISLEATVGDPKSRRAAGTVVITKGKMYKMPIMLGLMHVLFLSLPGDAAFTNGHLKYFIQGDKMVIEEIFLTGSALSLVGSGTMKMSNEELDLTFLTGPPGRLPRIAVIRNAVLNAILKELLVIRITGSLSKPIRKAVPLRSVDAILKELLSPGKTRK
ncbi:MAG: hypothetical protein QGH60_22435 [Phycisphaerae bacterium]|nr:hypothetical protein [Phycisphaerae bacterium]